MNDWVERALDVAHNIRRRAATVCATNNGGYLIQACGSSEILATLYTELMELGPSKGALKPANFDGVPTGAASDLIGGIYNGDRDRFFLSPAHYALGLYSVLCEVGRLGEDVLDNANADGSTLEMIGAEHSPGFEATTGSLAQALSVAVGQALVRKRMARPGRVWVLISDGELQEGQTWEALQAAVSFGLDNLTILLDANGLQVDGWVRDVMNIEPIADKVAAFGCLVTEVNGHDPAAIAAAARKHEEGLPTFVVCRTVPYRGIPSLSERHQLHYIRFREGEIDSMLADLSSREGQPA
jgi:transketolase